MLRRFGRVAAAALAVLTVTAWGELLIFSFGLGGARTSVTVALGVLALGCIVASVAAPRVLLPLYLALTLSGYPVGLVVSWVTMTLLFYGIITPVAVVARLVGRDIMGRRLMPEARTYWNDAPPQRDPDSYFKSY